MNPALIARELLTIEEFLELSAKINYQLSARSIKRQVLLALVLGPTDVTEEEQHALVDAIEVIQVGYDQARRRLGTPGVLHPLRAAAILSRALAPATFSHLLASLLHDKLEDLGRKQLGDERFEHLESRFGVLLATLGEARAETLRRNIDLLSHRSNESYLQYLVRMCRHAHEAPEVIHVKLCDRIDNTFDIHLQHPGITKFNFYRAVFDILFVPGFKGVHMGRFHFMPDSDEGVMLLSQLFKDTIFLAVMRHLGVDSMDPTTHRLFMGLAVAGIREAQWVALEIFNTRMTDVTSQRKLLAEVMEYCATGGISAVTEQARGSSLDGLIDRTFGDSATNTKQVLRDIYADTDLLSRLVLAFIVIFASFINDPDYQIAGISADGIHSQPG